jgi:hypothetical protein
MPQLKGGWHIVLAEGKTSLFKAMAKKISEYKPYGSSTTEQVIKTSESFVLIHNEQAFPLKNQKELLVILSDKKEELQAFVKKQDSKLSTEDKLTETVNYYNSLFVK